MRNLVNVILARPLRHSAGLAFLIGLFLISSCDTNDVLKQNSADNAIKEFVSTHDAPGSEDYKGAFNDSSIKAIDPVKQYSKTEAAAIAHLTYKNDRMSNFPIELKLVFIFRKTLDNKWVLTSFENTKDFGGLYTNDNGHLNIRAQ
jgi:hypothetical protein